MDLKTCYDRLNGYTDKNLTTKELKELGITKHFINKLVEKGKLERIKRGTYSVKSLNKQRNTKSHYAINGFCESIKTGNYDRAYYQLMYGFEVKNNCNSDNLFRIGFILLHEILENRKPFPFETLQELTLEKKPFSLYWNKFCTNVVNKDFVAAKENIEKSAELQLEHQGSVGGVTNAMIALVNKVISFKEDKRKIEENIANIKILLEDNKYEEALKKAEEILESINDDKLREKHNSLVELIKTVIAFKNDDKLQLRYVKNAICVNYHPRILIAYYLYNKEYLRALDYIDEVCHDNPNSFNQIVKNLLYQLKELNSIHTKEDNQINVAESNYHFKQFLKIFSIANIDEAKQELSLSISCADSKNKNYVFNCQLLEMIEKLVRMRDEGETFEEKNVKYNLKNDPIKNFNSAIQNGDYKKAAAFSHIIKLVNSVTFDIKCQLLNEMSRLDKINQENLVLTSSKEASKCLVTDEEDNMSIESPLISEKKPITEQTQKNLDGLIAEELMEEASKLEFNFDTIYELIYARDYELVYALIMKNKDRGNLDRLCSNCLRLIRQLKELEKSRPRTPYHNAPTEDRLKDFYQALNSYDYNFAYDLSDEIILQFSKTLEDSREFEVYKLLLEDLKELQEKVLNVKEEYDVLDDKVTFITMKQNLTREDIEELIKVLSRKIEVSLELSRPIDFELSLLNIAETTILSLDGRLNDTDFAKVECDSSKASEIFVNAINQGDYLTAKRLITCINWRELRNIYSFNYLNLAQKMLIIMNDNLRIVSDRTAVQDKVGKDPINEEMIAQISKLSWELMTPEEQNYTDFLHKIRSLIKGRHYEEVYQLFIKTDYPIEKIEGIADILGNLAFIKGNLDHKANELYEADPKNLNEYKRFISENYMEESDHYKQKILKSQE